MFWKLTHRLVLCTCASKQLKILFTKTATGKKNFQNLKLKAIQNNENFILVAQDYKKNSWIVYRK